MSRLTALHINLIGLGTGLVLALALYFALIKPKKEEVATTQAAAEQTRTSGGTPTMVKTKETELAKTKQDVAKTQADWAVNEVKYMPAIGFGTTESLLDTYQNKIIKLPTYFGERLSAWYDAQRPEVARLPGVEFPIDAFPTDPNAISQLTALKFPKDRWQVQVEAKYFDAAMAHLSKFNDMRGLGMPVINNVALQGTSPSLVMSYDLALYIIPRQAPPPSDPRLTGQPTGAAGAAGAGRGGAAGSATMPSGAAAGGGKLGGMGGRSKGNEE